MKAPAKPIVTRLALIALAVGAPIVLSSGCTLTGDGYGYNDGAAIGVDYYEPYGAYYGGWDSGYRVGPYRDGGRRSDDGGHPSPHAYRPAPASRSMPSIPSHGRSGGSSPRH